MHLYLNPDLVASYQKKSQKTRVLTETWMTENGYCPNCGNSTICKFKNNAPVADFFCPECDEQYELKSKAGKSLGTNVADGAYHTMIQRIQSDSNPNFFFLAYDRNHYSIKQLILVPKHFITTEMIIPRNKGIKGRPDYIMCSMNLSTLPESGKILLIDQDKVVEPSKVLQKWQDMLFLRKQKSEQKGWLLAILKCLDQLPEQFTLAQIYKFETQLATQFPNNRHIKDKIRQQLQVLRDQGLLEFSSCGQYRQINIKG
ncbi:DpnI domain-containing protein [Neisseria lisongii]|uniref:Restriction endonuclease n=1 Tax=Neisseria lisongii TaxID=2912188 RepID=A0AAW5AIM0_9NEIS|nr:DpnI domain-containing protein [Neisseria lisongii]MCF7529947.1 restriction endonuclease [Neisseria lisongii]